MKNEIRKLNKDMVLNVKFKITKEFKFRLWLSYKLIKLVAYILGCNVKIVKD